MRILIPCLIVLAGCLEVEEHIDQGKACVGSVEVLDTAGDVVSIAAGETATVTVVLDECASGSIQWEEQSCTVEASGSRLEVSSYAKSKTPKTQTDDCNWITVTCETPPLGEGTWTLAYGANTESFDVPYDGPSVCVDAPTE